MAGPIDATRLDAARLIFPEASLSDELCRRYERLFRQVLQRSAFTPAIPLLRHLLPLALPQRITIHHDGLPEPWMKSGLEATAAYLEKIRRFHVEPPPHGRGWADIGYHYAVDCAGRVWQCRPAIYQGAHVRHSNENNLGIVVLGNFDVARPPAEQLSGLAQLLMFLLAAYQMPPTRLFLHCELAQNNSSCPGEHLAAWCRQFRAGLALTA